MIGLALLCGHLAGDYLFQNDWMAANKTNPHPGIHPADKHTILRAGGAELVAKLGEIMTKHVPEISTDELKNNAAIVAEWEAKSRAWWIGNLACTVHCVLYALAVYLCLLPLTLAGLAPQFPWWFFAAVAAVHWPIDRFRLAGWWMRQVSGQKAFADGPLAPWSVIVVDNVIHVLTLYLLAVPVLA